MFVGQLEKIKKLVVVVCASLLYVCVCVCYISIAVQEDHSFTCV